MLAEGYRPVGKDFPVFLHPQSNEEYALARTERKTAPGYHGFAFNADPSVTLEDDLERRDLTINAMAEDADGSLVDPVRRQARSRCTRAAACFAGLRRRSRAHPARGPIPCPLCGARLPHRRRDNAADARHGRGRRGRPSRRRTGLGRNAQGADRTDPVGVPARACATAAPCASCSPKSTHSMACRSAPNTIPRSTPAFTTRWSSTWPHALPRAMT